MQTLCDTKVPRIVKEKVPMTARWEVAHALHDSVESYFDDPDVQKRFVEWQAVRERERSAKKR